MGKLGFYYNMAECTGCRTCQIACKDKNGLDIGILFRKVSSYETGTYPAARVYHYSGSCNNCENPACVKACPVGAMHVDDKGNVMPDLGKCIGCKSCVKACPYGEPQFFPKLNKTAKCNFCPDLRARGERPACVEACTMRILDFGDVDELKKKYGSDLVNALPVLPNPTTAPSVLVKAKDFMKSGDFVEIID